MSENHNIRFINSSYDELFRIPDGGKIKVDFPDRSFISPCKYIDDYHTKPAENDTLTKAPTNRRRSEECL